ncbi:unnamed protein product, partial [Oppiella nova]
MRVMIVVLSTLFVLVTFGDSISIKEDFSETMTKESTDVESFEQALNVTMFKVGARNCWECSYPCRGRYCCDGYYPQCCLVGNSFSNIDILSGITKDEGHMLAILSYPQILSNNFTENAFNTALNQMNEVFHNIHIETVSEYYLKNIDPDNSHEVSRAFSKLYGDVFMICPTYLFAKQFAMNSNRDAYFYMLTYQSNIFGSLKWDDHGDVVHGADMAFVFGHPLENIKSSEKNRKH